MENSTPFVKFIIGVMTGAIQVFILVKCGIWLIKIEVENKEKVPIIFRPLVNVMDLLFPMVREGLERKNKLK